MKVTHFCAWCQRPFVPRYQWLPTFIVRAVYAVLEFCGWKRSHGICKCCLAHIRKEWT